MAFDWRRRDGDRKGSETSEELIGARLRVNIVSILPYDRTGQAAHNWFVVKNEYGVCI